MENTLGFGVVAGFLWLSYRHKLATSQTAGVTSEMSGLTTYLVGALVYRGFFWIATTLVVISMFLLELKGVLEGLSKRVPPEEILTFTKFLLLTAVILPVLPSFGGVRTFPLIGMIGYLIALLSGEPLLPLADRTSVPSTSTRSRLG